MMGIELNDQHNATSRRAFIKKTGLGVALASAGCAAPGAPEVEPLPPAFFKETQYFIPHGTGNLETKIEHLGGYITPNHLFFVRNNSNSIRVDAESYRLSVSGAGVEDALDLSLEAIKNLPQRSLHAYLECGGNQRSYFGQTMGRPAQGTQWGRGGVGMAIWTGVSLRDVLRLANLRDDAVDIMLVGLDTDSPEGGFRRALPIEKAIDPDTLLAYEMNGEPLPLDHGFPLRAVVPGWVGSSSIKWLGSIEVATRRMWSRNTTTSYVLIGDAYEAEGEAKGKVATLQSIKSSLILPWPARLTAGTHRLRGYAYSPHGGIQNVEWRTKGNEQWQEARLIDPPKKYAWSRFEITWDAQAGNHHLVTRARDTDGNMQPNAIPHNDKGYLYNVPLEHPVQVS